MLGTRRFRVFRRGGARSGRGAGLSGAADPLPGYEAPPTWEGCDTLVGFVHEQVLTGRRPALEDLFPKEAFALELPLPRMHEIDYRF